MDAPANTRPQADEATKKRIKEAKLKAKKFNDEERKRKIKYRNDIEKRIQDFIQGDEETTKLIFEPMDKTQRSIAHDVAEIAGLPAYSFGEEGVDRYLVVWKKEHTPTEEELEALRNGEEYDPELAEKLAAEAENLRNQESADEKGQNRKRKNKNAEPEKYFEKYAKIVGENSGLDAAIITKTNQAYGMVPSKNKEDQRSIEQTMKDLQEKKRQRNETQTGPENT